MQTLLRRFLPPWLVLSVALASIGIAGLLVGRALSEPTARADDPNLQVDQNRGQPPPPGPDSTPIPGATPDKTVPDWYVPYLNQEKAAPKFHGEISGIQLGVASGPTPSCAKSQIEPDWQTATFGTPFDLNLKALPDRVSLWGEPRVGRCGDDGRVMWAMAILQVASGPFVSGMGGSVQVGRWESVRWASQEFLADRVTAGTIAGRPAVFADVGLSGFGQAAVFVLDKEIDGSTMVISSNVSLDYLKVIAEGLYR